MSVTELKKPTNKDAAEVLEEALERVRAGELTTVSVSWVTADGAIGGSNSSGGNTFTTWAAMEHNARSFYANVVCEE